MSRSMARCSRAEDVAAAGQRRRWEFGRREIRKNFVGPLLRSNRHGFWEKLFLLCELTMPSLAAFVVMLCGARAWPTASSCSVRSPDPAPLFVPFCSVALRS